MSKFAVVDDPRFDLHSPDGDIPETPQRTEGIRMILSDYHHIIPEPITREDLETVHRKHYVSHVLRKCRIVENDDIEYILSSSELPIQKGSEWALLNAAGSVRLACDLVMSEESSITRVFCNTRPPGHHAFPGKGMGFCFFNNVWLGAVRVLETHPEAKVLILDWDVHHGNGTQKFVEKYNGDNQLLFINTQQSWKTIWPNTGKPTKSKNYISYNFSPGDGDDEVKTLWKEQLLPEVSKFNPDIILISCGFDAHTSDPLGGLNFSSEIYGWMTKKLVRICPKIVSVLEGGYDVRAIVEASEYHVNELQ